MSTQVQRRRGTTAEHSTFTGAVGELTIDTDKDVVVVHDGATAGGMSMARAGGTNTFTGTQTFSGDISTAGDVILTGAGKGVIFEGTTADAFETTLEAGEPTADITITMPVVGSTTLAGTSIAQTWSADQTLAENVGIYFDASLSADGKYSGIVEDGTAGAALAFGELCYFQTADSRWEKSQAAAAQIATASLRLGICVLAAAGDGSATKMLTLGKIRADSLFPTFTIGAPVYMSAATAGVVTSTAPTGTTDFTVRKVGFAITGDELYFQPSNDYITLA